MIFQRASHILAATILITFGIISLDVAVPQATPPMALASQEVVERGPALSQGLSPTSKVGLPLIAQGRGTVVSGSTGSAGKAPLVAQKSSSTKSSVPARKDDKAPVWRSEELKMLGVGLGVGDVDGDGKNEIVVIDPSTVYLYRITGGHMGLVTEYSAGTLELKSVDVVNVRKQGPARIYVSAQNRGSVASFVLEFRNGSLVPVISDIPYFLRAVTYPTRGPILLGQQKSLRKMYDGPIVQMRDNGTSLDAGERFGIPLKIPIFGFAIGDLQGNRKPLIAVYDRDDHLRVYDPSGKKLYASKDYYGGSDVILQWGGPEKRPTGVAIDEPGEVTFFRPRILALDVAHTGVYQLLVTSHSSRTRHLMSRTKMLEEGRVEGLGWNGEALEEQWSSPKIQGMIIDFAVDSLPGLPGTRLITFERKKTDWMAYIRSRGEVKAYDLQSLTQEGPRRGQGE